MLNLMIFFSGRMFIMPGDVPASPPKFISLEELMKAANGMTNMALAHEIAVNKDFKLEKLEAPENRYIYSRKEKKKPFNKYFE